MIDKVKADLEDIHTRITGEGIDCRVHGDIVSSLRGSPVTVVQYDRTEYALDPGGRSTRTTNVYSVLLAVPPQEDPAVTPGFGSAFEASMGLADRIVSLFRTRKDVLRASPQVSVDRVSHEPVQHNSVLVSVVTIELSYTYMMQEI